MTTATSLSSRGPKLLDRLADVLHRRNYSPRLIHAYIDWVRRYIFFYDRRRPEELGIAEVSAFIEYLAGDGGATTFERAEAERALHFLYLVLLEKPCGFRISDFGFRIENQCDKDSGERFDVQSTARPVIVFLNSAFHIPHSAMAGAGSTG